MDIHTLWVPKHNIDIHPFSGHISWPESLWIHEHFQSKADTDSWLSTISHIILWVCSFDKFEPPTQHSWHLPAYQSVDNTLYHVYSYIHVQPLEQPFRLIWRLISVSRRFTSRSTHNICIPFNVSSTTEVSKLRTADHALN